jgi:hypothetical protein
MRRNGPTTLKPLRDRRNPRERDLGIASAVAELKAAVQKRSRETGGAADAWGQVIPPDLASGVELVRLVRGVLHVRPADAGLRFALDRLLRSGAERSLVEASRGKIKSVKLI